MPPNNVSATNMPRSKYIWFINENHTVYNFRYALCNHKLPFKKMVSNRSGWWWVNLVDTWGCDSNSSSTVFRLSIQNSIVGNCCEIVLWLMSQNLTNENLTLFQVMIWCRQATSHYLSQCWQWPRSPYDVTRPQWIHMQNMAPAQLPTTNSLPGGDPEEYQVSLSGQSHYCSVPRDSQQGVLSAH